MVPTLMSPAYLRGIETRVPKPGQEPICVSSLPKRNETHIRAGCSSRHNPSPAYLRGIETLGLREVWNSITVSAYLRGIETAGRTL